MVVSMLSVFLMNNEDVHVGYIGLNGPQKELQ